MAASGEAASHLMVTIWPQLHSAQSYPGCSQAMLIAQNLRKLQLLLNIAVIITQHMKPVHTSILASQRGNSGEISDLIFVKPSYLPT